MLIDIHEKNNNEIIFSVELPNSRAKRYIRKIIRESALSPVPQNEIKVSLECEFMNEWLEEASRRLDCKFIPDFYRIKNFKAEGKGHPIYFQCTAFLSKTLEEKHYKDFELELKIPEYDKEKDLNERIEEAFYELMEYHPSDEKVGENKIKAEIKVFNKDTGEAIEELSENFHDHLELSYLPEPVFKEFHNDYKAGDNFEVEFTVDEFEGEWFKEDYPDCKNLLYKIRVDTVYKTIYPKPPFTDEMAKKVGYKNMEEIVREAKTKQNLYEKNTYKFRLMKQYLTRVAENMDFVITKNMIRAKQFEHNIIDESNNFIQEPYILNSDDYFIKIILERTLAPKIFAAQGMQMDKRKLEEIIFSEYEEDSMPMEEFEEKMKELHCSQSLKWLELNIEKFITVKVLKVEDEAMRMQIF